MAELLPKPPPPNNEPGDAWVAVVDALDPKLKGEGLGADAADDPKAGEEPNENPEPDGAEAVAIPEEPKLKGGGEEPKAGGVELAPKPLFVAPEPNMVPFPNTDPVPVVATELAAPPNAGGEELNPPLPGVDDPNKVPEGEGAPKAGAEEAGEEPKLNDGVEVEAPKRDEEAPNVAFPEEELNMTATM